MPRILTSLFAAFAAAVSSFTANAQGVPTVPEWAPDYTGIYSRILCNAPENIDGPLPVSTDCPTIEINGVAEIVASVDSDGLGYVRSTALGPLMDMGALPSLRVEILFDMSISWYSGFSPELAKQRKMGIEPMSASEVVRSCEQGELFSALTVTNTELGLAPWTYVAPGCGLFYTLEETDQDYMVGTDLKAGDEVYFVYAVLGNDGQWYNTVPGLYTKIFGAQTSTVQPSPGDFCQEGDPRSFCNGCRPGESEDGDAGLPGAKWCYRPEN